MILRQDPDYMGFTAICKVTVKVIPDIKTKDCQLTESCKVMVNKATNIQWRINKNLNGEMQPSERVTGSFAGENQ